MPRAAAPFRQADLTRALRAAHAAGMNVAVRLVPGGGAILIPCPPQALDDAAAMPLPDEDGGDAWDAALAKLEAQK